MPLPPNVLPALRWLAYRVCGPAYRRHGEDCVQAGALALLRAREYDPAKGALTTWIVRNARGAMCDEMRQGRGVCPRHERRLRAKGKPGPSTLCHPDGTGAYLAARDGATAAADARDAWAVATAGMPPELVEAAYRCVGLGERTADVARVQGVVEVTARARRHGGMAIAGRTLRRSMAG